MTRTTSADAGATVGPIYNIADAIADPHFAEREIIVDVEDAEFGSLPMHNIVPRLSRTPGIFRNPAPRVGAENDQIYRSIGYSEERLAALRDRAVI